MTKKIFLSPQKTMNKENITFNDVKVFAYEKSFADELKSYGKNNILNIYRDMFYVRKFEEMLLSVKKNREYNGQPFYYEGASHLAIGQEAAAVGQAYALDVKDFSFGSHRAHGELIARGLRAIETLDDNSLVKIMSESSSKCNYEFLRAKFPQKSIKQIAIEFLLMGTACEIFARSNGFLKGMSGSMHVFFTPFGVYPNNAIVGGQVPIAVGSALYKKKANDGSIAVANFGDGAMGCGVVYESMNFSTMAQFTTLWENKGELPILFNVLNNGYGMGGQTRGETMGYDSPARLGAGITPHGMHAERVNGMNVFAVIDATTRKKKSILEDKKPALLDVVVYRYAGHSQSDKESCRVEEEIDAWRTLDPVENLKKDMLNSGAFTESEIDKLEEKILADINYIYTLSIDENVSSSIVNGGVKELEKTTFSNIDNYQCGVLNSEIKLPKQEISRIKEISKKARIKSSNGPSITLGEALTEAITEAFYRESSLVSYGENSRDWGGIAGVYNGLQEALPYERLFNSPVSEATMVSCAVGYAMSGGRVIIDFMYSDFMGRAGDEIFNQLAKWQAMSVGEFKMPIVLRVMVGTKYGTQHSQEWTALASHVPGLKVYFPATPYDARALMNKATSGSDPVIFFESQRLYEQEEILNEVPTEFTEIDCEKPTLVKSGDSVTIITLGAPLYRALEAEKALASKGVTVDIIDLKVVVPLNYEEIIASVKKTGRVVLVSDACERGSFLKEVASEITYRSFKDLKAPPIVLGAKNTVTPPYECDANFFPTAKDIEKAVLEVVRF